MQLRCVRAGRVVKAHRRRQVLVLGCNLLGRVLREQQAVGHDQCDRLADGMHLGTRQGGPKRFFFILPADALESDAARE